MAGPAVTLERVSLQLGGVTILKDISFSVAPGELCCVVGPNGGGKTSLIRSLLGQMPHRGDIRISGEEPVRLGYVPQFLEVDRTLPLTVIDLLSIMEQRKPAFFGTVKTHRPAMEAALERVGFVGKSQRRFGGLSGGERQRVIFAQALLTKPNLLILDEPTSNMDEDGARRIEEIVSEMNAAGVTVVWVNHNLKQVKRIAHRIAVIDTGLVYFGAPSEMPQTVTEAREELAL